MARPTQLSQTAALWSHLYTHSRRSLYLGDTLFAVFKSPLMLLTLHPHRHTYVKRLVHLCLNCAQQANPEQIANKIIAALCSVSMLTCPSDDMGPSPWCTSDSHPPLHIALCTCPNIRAIRRAHLIDVPCRASQPPSVPHNGSDGAQTCHQDAVTSPGGNFYPQQTYLLQDLTTTATAWKATMPSGSTPWAHTLWCALFWSRAVQEFSLTAAGTRCRSHLLIRFR